MTITLTVALVGSLIRLASYVGSEGNYFSLGLGHLIIGLANIRLLLDAFTHASNLNRNWTKLMVTSSIPGGYLLAQLAYQIIFTRKDAYIDHAQIGLKKIEIYMGV